MMEFEKKYKQWFESLEEERISFSEKKSLDATWDSIEEELILDDAWTGISTALGSSAISSNETPGSGDSSFLKPYIWIPLALIIATSLFWWLAPSTDKDNPERVISTEKILPPNPNRTDNINNPGHSESGSIKKLSNIPILLPEEENTSSSIVNRGGLEIFNLRPGLSINEIDGKPETEERKTEEIKNPITWKRINVPPPPLPESFLYYNPVFPDLHSSGTLQGFSPKKWFFYSLGISLSYNNSWIINDETLAGLDPGSLTDTRLSYAPEIGISAMMASTKGHRIEMELFLLSEQKQAYKQYINASYQEKQLTLAYQKVHFTWHIPIKVFPGRIGFGIFGSHLSGAKEQIGQTERIVTDEYNRFDYGLSLDYKLELAMTDRLIFTPAFRMQYSLPNSFRGNPSIPGEFRPTRNASAGINLGIYYRF